MPIILQNHLTGKKLLLKKKFNKIADLSPLKPYKSPFDSSINNNSKFEKDPFAFPDEYTPNDVLLKCPICNGNLPNTFVSGKCQNCKNTITDPIKSGIPAHTPDAPKGFKKKKYTILPRDIPLNVGSNNKFNLKNARKKKKELAEYDDNTAGDTYKVEFDQCMGNKDKEIKQRTNVDNIDMDEIMKSCLDLAIDG